jgi:hypothetical protein
MLETLVALAVLACTYCMPAQSATEDKATPISLLQKLVPDEDRTQVMVFGTFIIAEHKNEFKSVMLEKVIEQLGAFSPDVIAVHYLPGERIHELELRLNATFVHEELLSFRHVAKELELGRAAQKILKLDPVQARKIVTVGVLPSSNPEEALNRVLICLAAYELPTALLAWSNFSPEEKDSLHGISPDLAKSLDEELGQINVVQQLAIPLAKKLGLDSLANVGEFEAAEASRVVWENLVKNPPVYGAENKLATHAETDKRKKEAFGNECLLPYYSYLNSDGYMLRDVMTQWGAYLRSDFKDKSDRGRLALWENRNMKIAANIRALTAMNPGKRILVIIGASLKPFLDAYLSHSSDIKIVQPNFSEWACVPTKPGL